MLLHKIYDIHDKNMSFFSRPLYLKAQKIHLIFSGCDQSRYSKGCVEECSPRCKHKHCNVFNEFCTDGCSNLDALTLDCIGICFNPLVTSV